ncbi:MAG: hypothetical protein JOZ69_21195 [Myxococcales bacterium]|nr:hypothetical protein [Myxococcales bacterium]
MYLPSAFGGGTERILVVGGDTSTAGDMPINAAEVFTPSGVHGVAGAWTAASSTTVARDNGFILHLLDTGDVLVAGGQSDGARTMTAISEIFSYVRAIGASCAVNGDCTSGHCADGVCCDTACAGGTTDCPTCGGDNVSALVGRAGICSAKTSGTACNGAPTGPCNIQDTWDEHARLNRRACLGRGAPIIGRGGARILYVLPPPHFRLAAGRVPAGVAAHRGGAASTPASALPGGPGRERALRRPDAAV